MKTRVSNNCKKAEHLFWEENLQDGVKSQDMWGMSKKFLGIKSKGAPSQIIVDGQMVNDPKEVADKCLDALMNKVENTINSIPKSHADPIQYTRDYVASMNKCTFTYPTCNITRGVGYAEVKNAIKGLKYTNAAGIDHLNTRFVKTLRKPLIHILTCICNRSFEQQVYPDQYQCARVALLCKDPADSFNPVKYRPVSVLPAPSKVLEKVVVNRVTRHMERHGFFPDEQHGYRESRSCATAVLTLQEQVLKDLEEGKPSLVVLCDLSNAFDTLDHTMILEKLTVYGFTRSSINWYRSYLGRRSQFVGLAGTKGDLRRVKRGCPQGSLNGSVLFSIIFGDVVIVKLSAGGPIFIIYADDLTIRIILSGNCAVDEITINRQMAAVSQWMDSNLLSFNCKKTEMCLIMRGSREIYRDLKLTMKGQVIRPQRACRMLGMQITSDLRQDYYICQVKNNLCSFMNQRLYFLSRLRRTCGTQQFKQLIYGLLLSKAAFCSQVYTNCTEILKDQIRLKINRAIRMLANVTLADRQRTKDLYHEHSFLTFDSMVETADLNLLWSVMFKNTPQALAKQIWGQKYDQAERDKMQGPITRARSDPLRPIYNRNNLGTYHQRRAGWMSRSLRRYDQMLREEGAFYRDMSGKMDPKDRKKLLKEYYLERDFHGDNYVYTSQLY